MRFYLNVDGAVMKRKFFGMSIEVWDTEGNRLLTDVLRRIEMKLLYFFDVPLDGVCCFKEWVIRAKAVRPEMGYLLDWIEKDADISALCRYNLVNSPSDELRDEFNVTKMVLQRLEKSIDVAVLCSDFADVIESLKYVLKMEVKKIVKKDDTCEIFETSVGYMDWLSLKACWQLEYVEITRFDGIATSHKSEVAFSIAA